MFSGVKKQGKASRTTRLATAFWLVALGLRAQGTLVFDQQSSTDENVYWGTGGVMQQIAPPWGQSFTPVMNFVDFY